MGIKWDVWIDIVNMVVSFFYETIQNFKSELS